MENESITSLNQLQQILEQVTEEQYRRYFIPALLILGCILVILFSVTCNNQASGLSSGDAFAQELGNALIVKPEVVTVKTAYAADDGLYVYTQLTIEERSSALAWLQQQLLPFDETLAGANKGDSLTWIFDYGPAGEFREALVAPLSRASEPTYHQYLQINALPPILLNTPDFDPAAFAQNPALGGSGEYGDSLSNAENRFGQTVGRQLPTLDWFETYEAAFNAPALSDWVPLTGSWVATTGTLVQSDIQQYDATIHLASQSLARYRLETSFIREQGAFTLGLVLNAPILGENVDADFVTITNNGTLIETGYIDKDGINQFNSSFPINPPLDPALAHTLRLDANAGEYVLFLDGVEQARFGTRRASGHVGLTTSQGQFSFNNFRIENFESGFGGSEGFVSNADIEQPILSDTARVAQAPVEESNPAPVAPVVESVELDSLPDTNQPSTALIQPVETTGQVIQPLELGTGPTLIYTGGFDNGATGWSPITGNWVVNEGVYEQNDVAGFDFITMFEMDPLAHYSIEGEIRMIEGRNGGGFIYNAPDPATRIGAHLVDFTDDGRFLRWGYYNNDGDFVFIDGVTLDPGLSDGQFHNLRLVTHETETRIFVDGVEVGQTENQNSAGHLGLTSSQARVQFDDVFINQLPAETTALTGDFVDPFETQFPDNWISLSGEWQIIDNEYHQLDVNGFDLTTVSNFVGSDFLMKTRVRLVGGVMGAGIIYNMQSRDSIAGSQMFNFTQFGEALQWGQFNQSGDFVFQGIANVENASDGAWHDLELLVQNGRAQISYDGIILGDNIPLTYQEGFFGLLVSTSHVAFDDIQITALDGTLTNQVEEFESLSTVITFDNESDLDIWQPFSGNWFYGSGTYVQSEVDLFDLGTVVDYQMVGPHTIETDLRYVSGSMGGGLLFNMQSRTSKNESQMVSYTSDGRFIQWGDFDEAGVFNVKGSRQVTDAQEGEWHTLTVQVGDDAFDIILDGEVITNSVPLVYQNGYPGLVTNLSQVEFDNFTLDGRIRRLRSLDG